MYKDHAPASKQSNNRSNPNNRSNILTTCQWNELSRLLTEHNIPTRHALKAGIVTVRMAMGATPTDLPPGYAPQLEDLQQHIQENMQSYLSSLGVPELYTTCCEHNLWTPRQLHVRIHDGELDISQLQICCMRLHRTRLHVQNNMSVYFLCLVILLAFIKYM